MTLLESVFKIIAATLLAALGLVSRPADATIFMPQCFPFDNPSFFHDTVEVSHAGTSISASFDPGRILGGECGDVTFFAQSNGYDHLNWFQTVVKFPGFMQNRFGFPLLAPFQDPPAGGYFLQFADDLPWYYDEGTDSRFEVGLRLGDHIVLSSRPSTQDKMLTFFDAPSNIHIGALGGYMQFNTLLVGIYEDGSSDPLFAFDWKSNATGWSGSVFDVVPDDPGDIFLVRAAQPLSGSGTGGIFEVQSLASPNDADPAIKALWAANGININVASEPPAVLLVLLALSVLLGCRRILCLPRMSPCPYIH